MCNIEDIIKMKFKTVDLRNLECFSMYTYMFVSVPCFLEYNKCMQISWVYEDILFYRINIIYIYI